MMNWAMQQDQVGFDSEEQKEFELQERERDDRERRWAEEAHKQMHMEEANDGD